MCNVVPPQVYETLKKVTEEDLDNFEIIIHDANKKGEGFLGDIVFITLQDKRSTKAIDLVVKQAFSNQSIRDNHPIRQVFINEIYFYTQVWTRLNRFQETIPLECQFQKVPKYFTSIIEDGSEKVVLENLKIQKFRVHNKKIPLDKDHYELIFREYGKFHALSFAYKALHPEDYNNLANGLCDVYSDFIYREGFSKAIERINQIAMDSLQPGVDDVVIKKFRPYIDDYVKLFLDSVDCDAKYNVITHGDCWSNNLMFKYDEDGKLTDIRILDFQLSKMGSPCCDLSYCLYSGASEEVLQDLNHFLQVYYDSLSETLKAFGCEAEKLYPFKELRNDWKRYCKMGVMMSLIIWKLKCTYEENMFDLKDTIPEEGRSTGFLTGYDKEAFRKICRNILFHLYENDFL